MSLMLSKRRSAAELRKPTRGISTAMEKLIAFAPFFIVGGYSLLLFIPRTRRLALILLGENQLVELLTFSFLLLGGIGGVALAWRAKREAEPILVWGFYALFSTGLLFIAMEEISWGQSLFHFSTPAAWKGVNVQNEFNLHNLNGFQGQHDLLRLAFGLGGLLGVWLAARGIAPKIGAPLPLLSWFLLITLHGGLDCLEDVFPLEKRFDRDLEAMAELVEGLIALAGCLYLALNARKLAAEWKAKRLRALSDPRVPVSTHG